MAEKTEKIERIYTVPLGEAYRKVRTKRTRNAVKILRSFIAKHMKADEEDVSISTALNSYIWRRSAQKPPRKVKIRTIKENGKVKTYLADEKIEEPKKEAPKKEEKTKDDKKTEEKKKEEAKKEETIKGETARIQKEVKKAMSDQQAKTANAENKKMAQGKEQI